MSARSTRLYNGLIDANPKTLWTSPTGKVTIVKSFYFDNSAGSTQTVTLRTPNSSGRVLRRAISIASNGFVEWTPWFALEPGDSLLAEPSVTNSVSVYVSGAVLVA